MYSLEPTCQNNRGIPLGIETSPQTPASGRAKTDKDHRNLSPAISDGLREINFDWVFECATVGRGYRTTLSAVTGMTSFLSSTGGESSNVQVIPMLSSRIPTSKESSEGMGMGMGMVSSGSFGCPFQPESSSYPPLPASVLLLPMVPATSLGSVKLLVGSELNSSPVCSSSSLVLTIPSMQAPAASFVHIPADPVEEKKSVEDPSCIPESVATLPLSIGSTLGEKARDGVFWWRKEISKLLEKKDQPIVCNQSWEKDRWRFEADLSLRFCLGSSRICFWVFLLG
jgi:hypothetical protein